MDQETAPTEETQAAVLRAFALDRKIKDELQAGRQAYDDVTRAANETYEAKLRAVEELRQELLIVEEKLYGREEAAHRRVLREEAAHRRALREEYPNTYRP